MVSSKPASPRLRLAGTGVLVALLCACQPSMEEQVARHRPAVEAVFARIKALDAVVRDTPPLTEDTMSAPSGQVVLDGTAEKKSNALFIFARDLAAPEQASREGLGGTWAADVEVCGEGLRSDPSTLSVGVPLFLEDCARAEYLFVLRTAEEQTAELLDKDSFQAGKYAGEVLLFRLADGAPLGGFRVAAASSDTVEALVDEQGNPIDASERLESDHNANVFVDIQQKLRKHVPGSIPD